jgi:hypothetical protein
MIFRQIDFKGVPILVVNHRISQLIVLPDFANYCKTEAAKPEAQALCLKITNGQGGKLFF